MRSDFVMYVLAVVFLLLTIVPAVAVSEENGRTLWMIFTIVLGILFAFAGLLQKPKPKEQSNVAVPVAAVEEPRSVAVPAEASIAPKVETPLAETAKAEASPATEASVPVSTDVKVEQPAAAEEKAPIAVSTTSELTQIRGINDKRAAQLKANGIHTIADLAAASADDLANKITVSPKIVKMWIGTAKKLVK